MFKVWLHSWNRPIVAALVLLTPAVASDALQADMDALLKADPRNTGVVVHVSRASADMLAYDLVSVAPTNSMADVFRVLLQFASAEKGQQFKNVQLSFRGTPRFLINGAYFRQLGQEFRIQNPVYTMRTFPENLTKMDGSRAYQSWSGGLLAVVGKQMEDANDFHRTWWMRDFAAAAQPGLGDALAPKLPASTTAFSRDGSTSSPTIQTAGGAKSPGSPQQDRGVARSPEPSNNQPLQIPTWLGFPQDGLDKHTVAPNHVQAAYETHESFVAETGRFETQLHKAADSGVTYDENGNGYSVLFKIAQGRISCALQIRENGARIHVGARTLVEVDCTLGPETQPGASPSTAQSGQLMLPAGAHRIEYRIDGSARLVGVTYRNPSGGTEQRDAALPASMSFYAMNGSFVYLSAQNKADAGEVHVVVTVDGRILQEATSSTAYGIATASGSVPR